MKPASQVHRRESHVDYYYRTIERRRKLARDGKLRRYWTKWLVDELCPNWARWLINEVLAELQ